MINRDSNGLISVYRWRLQPIISLTMYTEVNCSYFLLSANRRFYSKTIFQEIATFMKKPHPLVIYGWITDKTKISKFPMKLSQHITSSTQEILYSTCPNCGDMILELGCSSTLGSFMHEICFVPIHVQEYNKNGRFCLS